jgi:hypothetical protein
LVGRWGSWDTVAALLGFSSRNWQITIKPKIRLRYPQFPFEHILSSVFWLCIHGLTLPLILLHPLSGQRGRNILTGQWVMFTPFTSRVGPSSRKAIPRLHETDEVYRQSGLTSREQARCALSISLNTARESALSLGTKESVSSFFAPKLAPHQGAKVLKLPSYYNERAHTTGLGLHTTTIPQETPLQPNKDASYRCWHLSCSENNIAYLLGCG